MPKPDISPKEYMYAYVTDTHHYEGEMRIERLAPPLHGRLNNAGKVVTVTVRDRATDLEEMISSAIIGEIYGEDVQECWEKTTAAANAWCAADAVKRGGRGEPFGS